MKYYLDISTQIYNIYLKYVSSQDIHVYSIDEVFIDATPYLNTYHLTPKEFAMKMILDIYETTGITATAGIGTIYILPRWRWILWLNIKIQMRMGFVLRL